MTPNVDLTGAARLYRAASSDQRERGLAPCWASFCENGFNECDRRADDESNNAGDH